MNSVNLTKSILLQVLLWLLIGESAYSVHFVSCKTKSKHLLDYNRTNDSIHFYEIDCMLPMPIGLVCLPHSDDTAKFLMILNLLSAHKSLAQ